MATEGVCPSLEETKRVRTSGVEWEAKQPTVRTWFRHYSLSSVESTWITTQVQSLHFWLCSLQNWHYLSPPEWLGQHLTIPHPRGFPPTPRKASPSHLSHWQDTIQIQTGERETAFHPPVQASLITDVHNAPLPTAVLGWGSANHVQELPVCQHAMQAAISVLGQNPAEDKPQARNLLWSPAAPPSPLRLR